MRFILCEKSIEMITDAPHAGEYESLEDAKRAADRRQEFLSTELAIEDEAGNLIAYRPGIRPWVYCVDPHMFG